MTLKRRDETRWLARLIAAYLLIFAANGLVMNALAVFHASCEGSEQVWVVVGLVLSVLLLWLAFRFFICSSLWGLLDFLNKESLFTYLQCRYFSINQHIRSGLTGSAMMLLTVYPLGVMIRMSNCAWFSTVAESLFAILLWPFRVAGGFQLEPRGLVFAMLMVYCVGTGFAAGAGLSLAAGVLAETSCDPDMPE